jgi:hypothetical protein
MLSTASARIARLPSWVAIAILRRASRVMIGTASNATINPRQRKRLAVARPKTPSGPGDNVGGQREQQASADLAGGSLGTLGKNLPMTQIDIQTPDEHTGRCQFDHAIEPERRERRASRRNTGADFLQQHTVSPMASGRNASGVP